MSEFITQVSTPIDRRGFLTAVGLGPAALAAGGSAGASQARADRPNLVLIMADDFGYGDLGCYGSPNPQTPHIDRMAEEGVRFTQFYSTTPYCAPARAALMTGRYPTRVGITRNPCPDLGWNVGLPTSEITLAQALKARGYASICLGKWHLGHTEEYLPHRRGFDEYYGILYSNDMRPVQHVHNDRVAEYPVVQPNATKEYTNRALRFIELNKDRPFFLYMPHPMPHKPLAPSEDFYTPETPDDLYADVMRELDWSVGRILAKLRELKLDENTLVVFTSDNGPWYGGSTAGLRGMKSTFWDGGLRVPMIARWPGKIRAGRVSHEVAGLIDFFPTFCGLAGAPQPQDRVIDGRDIFPLMSADGARSPHEAFYGMTGTSMRVIRSGNWKLHVRAPLGGPRYMEDAREWVDPRGPDGVTIIAQWEQPRPDQYPGLLTGDEPKDMMLFDLEADPGEQRNLADHQPQVAKRLRELFDDTEARMPEWPDVQPDFKGMKLLKGGALRYDVETMPGRRE